MDKNNRRPYQNQKKRLKFGEKLVIQIIICIFVIGAVFLLKQMKWDQSDEAIAVFQSYLQKDYTTEEVIDSTVTLGQTILETPISAYENLVGQTASQQFILPCDEITASVFESTMNKAEEGEIVSEHTLEFVSDEEIQVYASNGGTVTELEYDEVSKRFSFCIIHENKIMTKYTGIGGIYVKDLQRVRKGDLIASIIPGESNQLTFEIWEDGVQQNPYEYIKQ